MTAPDTSRGTIGTILGAVIVAALIGAEVLGNTASHDTAIATTPAKDSATTGAVLIDASTGHTGQRSDSARTVNLLATAHGECNHPSAVKMRRNVAHHPDWNDQTLMDVACRYIRMGMTAEQLRASWGGPQSINSTTTSYSHNEQWVYGSGTYVYLDDGVITSWQDTR